MDLSSIRPDVTRTIAKRPGALGRSALDAPYREGRLVPLRARYRSLSEAARTMSTVAFLSWKPSARRLSISARAVPDR